MEKAIFPPSPTWFLPNIIGTKDDGSVCYGSKNNVVILKSKEDKKADILIIQEAHSQKVTCVAFSPSHCHESLRNMVVSGSEDGFVKLWNLDTLAPTIGHKCHKEQNEDVGTVLSLDWSISNPHHIVSAADNNTLVLWDVFANTTMKFIFQKLGATVVSCCPYNEKIVAVGSKNGQIYIINLRGNGEMIYKLRGHDNKIHSLSWCPIPYNVFKVNELHEEFLLGSSCQSKEVFIWRVGTDGKCETKFHIPTSALSKRESQHHGKLGNSTSYVALCWLEPNKIYLSSNFGELIYFDIKTFVLSKMAGGSTLGQKANKHLLNSFKLGHCFHTKGLYAITGTNTKVEIILSQKLNIESELQFAIESNNVEIIKKIDTELTWDVIVPESSSLVWTSGTDRKLLGCESRGNAMDLVYNYNTMNGFVYCAVVSPHDPNKVAIGVGDGMVRLWNLTDPSGDLQVYWQKIKDRVMSLDWHPTKDGILAYGTSEGRVGVIDTKSTKPPTVFKPYHSQPIYSLSWGPQFSSKDKSESPEFDLYCIGDNTLSLYSISKVNVDPLNLSKMIPFPCKKQTDVCWKPDYSFMAVGSEDGSICIVEPFNFQIVYVLHAYKKLIQSIAWHPCSTTIDSGISPYHGYFTSGSADNECEIRVFHCQQVEADVEVELVAKLKGHSGHVQSVSWSPHISGQLVSTSVDCSVQIWDVVTQTPLVNFIPLGMPMFSIWSPIDPDFIFTGCRSDILYVWPISSQTGITPKPKSKKQKKDRNIQMSLSKELTPGISEDLEKKKSTKIEVMTVAETKTVAKSSKEGKMFTKIWKGEDELKNCYLLLKNEEENERNYSLGFLCEGEYFKEAIEAEEEFHKKSNNWTELCELSLWKGNFKEILQSKITSGQLNDFLVSLAPMVSPRVWQEACLSYSKTLVEKKFYRKAASYLIVCHKIYEAIELLVDANLFLEAICIGRSRLDESDPLLNDVIRKYADWLFRNGNFLKACECYIYLKEYKEVAQICGKKNQPEYLNLAALAAKKCESFDVEALESTNALLKCFESQNFELAEQICNDHPDLKFLNLLFFVYYTIHQLEAGELELRKNIICYIRQAFKGENVVFPEFIPKLFHKYTFYKNKRQVFIIVAQELSFAACAEDIEDTATHLTKALSTCSRYIQSSEEEVHPLYRLCCWLSPEGFLSENSVFSLPTTLVPFKIKSLRAFLCASIVRHLNSSQKTEDVLKNLELLSLLKEDLLDPDSFKYFQNLMVIDICKKRLLKNRCNLSKLKISIEMLEKENEGLESSERISGNDSDTGNGEEREIIMTKSETNLTESCSFEIRTVQYDEIDELPSKSETETEIDLEEKVLKDMELMEKLKNEIANFESVRISSPNPVPVYFMLKKLCEGIIPECESAKILLNDLEKKWQELN